MRVVTWNIERGYAPEQIVGQLQELDADVYLLSELDRGVGRTNGVDMFSLIQDGLSMDGRYVREFLELETARPRWSGKGGGESGNAIFTRYPILSYQPIDLPLKAPLLYEGTTFFPEMLEPRRGSRKAQVMRVESPDGPLSVVGTHLEIFHCDGEHRRAQLEAALERSDGPLVLGGDFNTIEGAIRATLLRRPGYGEVRALRSWLEGRGLTDPFPDSEKTCGRLGIRAKLDWLAASAELAVRDARVVRSDLSDHDCLVVEYDTSRLRSAGL